MLTLIIAKIARFFIKIGERLLNFVYGPKGMEIRQYKDKSNKVQTFLLSMMAFWCPLLIIAAIESIAKPSKITLIVVASALVIPAVIGIWTLTARANANKQYPIMQEEIRIAKEKRAAEKEKNRLEQLEQIEKAEAEREARKAAAAQASGTADDNAQQADENDNDLSYQQQSAQAGGYCRKCGRYIEPGTTYRCPDCGSSDIMYI